MEYDFGSNNAFLSLHEIPSDDVRDQLFRQFRDQLAYYSSWLTIEFKEFPEETEMLFNIYPISPDKMFVEGIKMLKRHFDILEPDEDTDAHRLKKALESF